MRQEQKTRARRTDETEVTETEVEVRTEDRTREDILNDVEEVLENIDQVLEECTVECDTCPCGLPNALCHVLGGGSENS